MRQFINIVETAIDYDDEDDSDSHEADILPTIWPKEAVKNPAFLRWFQGSKVIDKSGLPLMVYRGRSQRWTVMPTDNAAALRANLKASGLDNGFHPEIDFAERLGDVAWFTDDEGTAYGYLDGAAGGDVLAAYLNLQNPLILSVDMLGQDEAERRLSHILETPVSLSAQYGSPAKAMADEIVYDNSIIVEWARANGHDGLIHDDTTINGRTTHTSYVVFAPHQIKAAKNTGEFNPNDYNIHR